MPPSVQKQLEQLQTDLAALTVRFGVLETTLAPVVAEADGLASLVDRLPLWIGPPPQPPEP